MSDRFKFRLPFYDNQGNFTHFEYLEIGKGLEPYNAGTTHHHNEYEQCTGLKDKNGNLIYEGDVVKFGAFGLLRGVVKFGEYENCMPCGDENVYCNCIGWYLDDGYSAYALNNDNLFEITGNVHETKDNK